MEAHKNVNDKYKDRLFNFIFGSEENREWTLSLYNAINGSSYTDPSEIRFNTLKNVLFMGMKNDTSFIIQDIMSVYEHQSTLCGNMPLRLLEYVNDLYTGYITSNKFNKYGKKIIKLPIPKLVVFYNGIEDTEDESILRLSDSFDEEHREEADIEVRVRMINVNFGRNKKLMDCCKPLSEYAWFIQEVRRKQIESGLIDAVHNAIKEMPDSFSIKSFLVIHQQEVEGMLDTEYNEAEVMELFKKEAREEGREEGRDDTLYSLVNENLLDVEVAAAKANKSAEQFKKDMEEYLNKMQDK